MHTLRDISCNLETVDNLWDELFMYVENRSYEGIGNLILVILTRTKRYGLIVHRTCVMVYWVDVFNILVHRCRQ